MALRLPRARSQDAVAMGMEARFCTKILVALVGQCAEVSLSVDPTEPNSNCDFKFPEPGRELVVLVPTPAAAYCYLFEALLWVAIQRIPLASPWDDGIDRRVNTEDMDNVEPRLEFEPVRDEECSRAGLPLNPEYALLFSGDYHSRPEDLERIVLLDAEPADHEKLQAQLEAARRHYKAVDAWDQQFEEFLDLPKGRLFVALREGKILCAGKRIPLLAKYRGSPASS
jgi:hypothetical protein